MSAFPVDDLESGVTFEPLAESDSEPLRCTEPGCTNAIEYSGRGRKPTKCPEHKRSGNSGTRANNKSAASGKSWARATEVKTHLDGYVAPINLALLGLAQFTQNAAFIADGAVIAKQLPAVNTELVELAKDDKDLQKVLESIALPTKYAPLMLSLFGLAVPILANHHLLPEAMAAGIMGVMAGQMDNAKGGE